MRLREDENYYYELDEIEDDAGDVTGNDSRRGNPRSEGNDDVSYTYEVVTQEGDHDHNRSEVTEGAEAGDGGEGVVSYYVDEVPPEDEEVGLATPASPATST